MSAPGRHPRAAAGQRRQRGGPQLRPPPWRQRGGPRLRTPPREPGGQPIGGQQPPPPSAGANRIPGADAVRGRSQSAARTGRGRTRAEIQTGGVGAERPAGRAGRAVGAGDCRVSAAPGLGGASVPTGPDGAGGLRTGRVRMRGRPGAARLRPESWGGYAAGAPRAPASSPKGVRHGRGPGRSARAGPASPLAAESRKEAGWKTGAVDTGRQGPQDWRSGLSILRPPLRL